MNGELPEPPWYEPPEAWPTRWEELEPHQQREFYVVNFPRLLGEEELRAEGAGP
jgi:hypothetical protein